MADTHPIVISKVPERVTVIWRGRKILETSAALSLKEHVYPEVLYFPRDDADMNFFERTARVTTCPYKGAANYFSLRAEGAAEENTVWTYETPKAGVSEIAGFLAFYPDKVEVVRG